MTKRHSNLSLAAVFAASVLAWQVPQAIAAGDNASAGQQGVPGVEVNVGNDASDRGLPGVEMNVGRQGDQDNMDTRTLGAGTDAGSSTDMRTGTAGSADLSANGDASTSRPLRTDRN